MNILFIALGLAMDAFAVSITSGFTIKHIRIHHAVRIGFFFGLFQAIMPLIGWAAGLGIRDIVAEVDHWIAFSLLTLIGGKMIYESFKLQSVEQRTDVLRIQTLLMLSLATSIDALVMGITFALLNVSILMPVLIIGIVTFFLSFLGVYIGDRLGHFFENKMEFVGGLVLIGIGIKILVEHLS